MEEVMDKIDAVIKLVEKEFYIFYFSFYKENAVDRYRILFNEVIGLIETLRETEVKEVNREIDNVFNQMINTYKVFSKNMYDELYKKSVEFDDRHIETINNLKEKLKYNIDLAVRDKLEGISK
jgi:hypothetical protein